MRLKVPHMGWSDVEPQRDSRMFRSWEGECRFYFVHSYYVDPADPEVIAGRSAYGREFVCAMETGNILGAQFHPEKSHAMGMRYLRNVYSD